MTPRPYVSHDFRKWRTPLPGCLLLAWTFLLWSPRLFGLAAPLAGDPGDLVQMPDLDYSKDRWLADATFYDVDQFQAGDAEDALITDLSSELCPRVPNQLPVDSCDVHQCISDDDCSDRQLKCCYNGCVYTCLPEVHHPVHFDWIREPRRRLQSGPSWLVPGPDDNIDVEMCSTSFQEDEDDDSDPLVCPHGYECSIDDPGKPEAGIPNRGHCVKVVNVKEVTEATKLEPGGSMGQMLQADAPYKFPATRHCMLGYDGLMLLSGHSITKDGRECFCVEAKLKCDNKKQVPPD